jgi:uncharacterized membrane protein
MSRKFSINPTLVLRGREFKGLRGFSGKPFHPPLTDFPVAAYIFAAIFDVISRVAGDDSTIGREFFVSATHVIIAGAAVSIFTALTGFWDWLRSTEPGTQVRRTANWHMAVMITVTVIVLVDIVIRLAQWSDHVATTPLVMVLTIVVGGLVGFGAMYGGSMVFEYGFNVETASDSPVWHPSEVDVAPDEEREQATT